MDLLGFKLFNKSVWRRRVLGRDVAVPREVREELRKQPISPQEYELLSEVQGWCWARGVTVVIGHDLCVIMHDKNAEKETAEGEIPSAEE